MSLINKYRIKPKLVVAFSVQIALLLINALIGFKSSSNINRTLNTVFEKRLPALDYLIEADRDFQQALVAERSMLLVEPGSNEFETLEADYNENIDQVKERFEKYTQLTTNEQETKIIPSFNYDLGVWLESTGKVLNLAGRGSEEGLAEASRQSFGDANEKFSIAREHLNTLTEYVLDNATQESKAANFDFKAASLTLLLVSIIGLVLGLVVATVISINITEPAWIYYRQGKKIV